MIRKLKMPYLLKFVSVFTIMAMLSVMIGPLSADASTVTKAKATFGRLKTGINSSSVVVQFNSPTGIQAGTSDDIILTFSADFTLAAESATNFDIGLGNAACESSPTFSDEGVQLGAPDASNWQVDVTGNVMTFDPDTDSSLTAGRCVQIEMGTAATTGGTGSADTVQNGAADDDDTIAITGGFGDTGTITVDIVADEQVGISATVNQSITFDLDTTAADTCGATESGAAYTVPLGTITTSDTRVSGATDSVNMICVDLDTNASGGAVVTVNNLNGANGLKSTSTPADDIASTDGSVADNTENYGLCVVTVAQTSGTLAEGGGYIGDTCAANSETNNVQALSTTPESILTSSGAPIAGGRGTIAVNASITGVQPAHADYADTLTFIATGTF